MVYEPKSYSVSRSSLSTRTNPLHFTALYTVQKIGLTRLKHNNDYSTETGTLFVGLPALHTGDVPPNPATGSKSYASVLLSTRRSSRYLNYTHHLSTDHS